MFWIAALGATLSWMLIKLGVMSATVGFLSLALKLLLVLVVGAVLVWSWTRLRSKA